MNIEDLLRETFSDMAREEAPPPPERFLPARRRPRGLALAAAAAVTVLVAGATLVIQNGSSRQPEPVAGASEGPVAEVWPRAVRVVPEKLPNGPAFEPELYLPDGSLLARTGKGDKPVWWSYNLSSGTARRLIDFVPPAKTDYTSTVITGGGQLLWYTVSWGKIKGALDIWAVSTSGGAAHKVTSFAQTMKYGDISMLTVADGKAVWSRGINGGIYQAPLSGGKPRFVPGTKARHLLQWPWAGITTRRAADPSGEPDFQHLVNVLTGERRDAVVKQGEPKWGCSLTWCLTGLNVRHRDGSRVRALPGGTDWILSRTPALDRFVVLRQATGDDDARLVLYDLPTGRKGDLGARLKKRGKDTAAMMNDAQIDYETRNLLAYHLDGKQVIVDLTAIK
ncbi:hypothetical protein [Nonomuraea guangzhouensis]|uniref:WD40 repeat domain-containing protein n=1 Tax=Nonomuraea guangzhouensis TaxID=1291555 RepID=A0ABW4G5F0_9ACTN|nr:hypothetical protein [Nonomuraea guangzhouensis]